MWQEMLQPPFFQLQANELVPINEKILIQFDQLKNQVLIRRSLFTKLQKLKLTAAAHYFCHGHSHGNLASAYPQVKGAQIQNFYRSYTDMDSASMGNKLNMDF